MSASEKAALLPTLAASFVIGLVLSPRWDISVGALFLFLLASLLLAALSFSIRRSALPALALTALLLGLLRAGSVEPPGAELRPYQDLARTEVQGVVTDDPTGSDTFLTFRLSAERLRPDDDSHWREVSGDVRVTARVPAALSGSRDAPFIRYGDRLALTGKLEAPGHFGVFDFPAYLEAQGIGTVMRFPDAALIGEDDGSPFYRWLYSLRRDMARATSAVIPEPQASFGQAILLGIRDSLPDSLTEDFRRAGTAHLLAISGLHVGILLAISISASEFLVGRRRQLYLALPMLAIWVYALISGASDSAIRAAIMGTVYVAAIAVGRPRSLIPALALAAALMAAIEPRVLSRVSFQLSFAAMTGIAIYYEILSDRITEWLRIGPEREEWWATALRGLVGAVGITVAATLATAPLVMFYFERVSLVGLPATLLSMPRAAARSSRAWSDRAGRDSVRGRGDALRMDCLDFVRLYHRRHIAVRRAANSVGGDGRTGARLRLGVLRRDSGVGRPAVQPDKMEPSQTSEPIQYLECRDSMAVRGAGARDGGGCVDGRAEPSRRNAQGRVRRRRTGGT